MNEQVNQQGQILGSGVSCEFCGKGTWWATYGGNGEVDGYYCDTCMSGFEENLSCDFEDCGEYEGLACSVDQTGWFVVEVDERQYGEIDYDLRDSACDYYNR